MLIKQPDDRSPHLMELERIKEAYPDQAGLVDSEMLRIYLKDALHMFAESVDLHLGELSDDVAVLHDLRLPYGEQVVEIDHLLINRSLQFTLVDSGFMGAERVKVNALGEVFVWSDEGQEWVGVRRAFPELFEKADLLEKILAEEPWPRRLGMRLSHSLEVCLVLGDDDQVDVENVSRWGDRVFKLSEFVRHYERERLKKISLSQGVVNAVQAAFNRVSRETLQNVAQGLADLHELEPLDYLERWELDQIPPQAAAEEAAPAQGLSEAQTQPTTEAPPAAPETADTPAQEGGEGAPAGKKGGGGRSRRSPRKGKGGSGQGAAQPADAQAPTGVGEAPPASPSGEAAPAAGTDPAQAGGQPQQQEGDRPAAAQGEAEASTAAHKPSSAGGGKAATRGKGRGSGGQGKGPSRSGKGDAELLPSSRIASSLKMKTPAFLEMMQERGFLQRDAEGHLELTEKGRQHGGRARGKGGNRSFSWPREIRDVLK
ncbi:hypothetical protein SAMN05421721_1029 [Ectothiorhodospira mobilis]|uniref:Uncharacterized protein n=1 Tax=Ectothiorhodospira mobilis TaxID=195064 RepID=A0A1I4PKM8_ECTMO|nr:nuclease-related domain-containing protein [Ectothiorhodospira mobilis]SFM28389.1 hypothetical protein SAMN05421721_1029 [Ectothiorhodospira mobilis]